MQIHNLNKPLSFEEFEKLVENDYRLFEKVCKDILFHHFNKEEFPRVAIGSLKSEVRRRIEKDKTYMKILRARYSRIGNEDKIFKELLTTPYLKDEASFKEFYASCKEEYDSLIAAANGRPCTVIPCEDLRFNLYYLKYMD